MTGDRASTDDRAGRTESATFAPVRVASSGRPPLVGSLIAGMLVLAVVLAATGHDQPSTSADVANATTGNVAIEASPEPSYPVVSVAAGSTIPDPFDVNVVTSGQRITVTGTLGVHADLVTVTLQTAEGATADWMLLGVRNPDGAIRLDDTPPFSARFNLAKAVASSPLWVQVDAFSDTGARVASSREPILVRWARVGPGGFRQR